MATSSHFGGACHEQCQVSRGVPFPCIFATFVVAILRTVDRPVLPTSQFQEYSPFATRRVPGRKEAANAVQRTP